MEPLVPGRPDSLLKGKGILLVEADQKGSTRNTLALDVDSTYEEVWGTLLSIGVKERNG